MIPFKRTSWKAYCIDFLHENFERMHSRCIGTPTRHMYVRFDCRWKCWGERSARPSATFGGRCMAHLVQCVRTARTVRPIRWWPANGEVFSVLRRVRRVWEGFIGYVHVRFFGLVPCWFLQVVGLCVSVGRSVRAFFGRRTKLAWIFGRVSVVAADFCSLYWSCFNKYFVWNKKLKIYVVIKKLSENFILNLWKLAQFKRRHSP